MRGLSMSPETGSGVDGKKKKPQEKMQKPLLESRENGTDSKFHKDVLCEHRKHD